MSDEELVKALRDTYDLVKLWPEKRPDGFTDLLVLRNLVPDTADRIEALTEQLKTVLNREAATTARYDAKTDELEAKLAECLERNALLEARLGKAVELLKEARQDLEEYVTHEWPKDEHPVYERKWERDMELCRRIDATLAEIESSEAVTPYGLEGEQP
jgi:chromosome segregation ATPase